MKTIKTLSVIMLTALFAACSQDEAVTEVVQEQIQLTSGIDAFTRGTSLTEQSTSILNGQKVGVTIVGGSIATYSNQPWTAQSDGTLKNDGDAIYYGSGQATITAYQPYKESWSDVTTNKVFSVNETQTGVGYRNADLLFATNTASHSKNPVKLSFTHKMAKITVTVTGSGVDLAGATVYVLGTKPSVSFNPSSGALGSAGGNPIVITAATLTSSANTAAAIIVPQTIAAGTEFIQVKVGTKTFTYTQPTALTCASGNSYHFTLNILNDKVELTGSNLTDWTDNPLTSSSVTQD